MIAGFRATSESALSIKERQTGLDDCTTDRYEKTEERKGNQGKTNVERKYIGAPTIYIHFHTIY